MSETHEVQQNVSGRTSRVPKVSVVVPNYNYARFLDLRIQSLLNQTFTDFELIIADDGSTDGSQDVIRKYAGDPRVKPIFYTKNSGLIYQRWNDGAALARGEYLIFPGSDDSADPTLLEKLVKVLDANPSVGLAYAQVWITDGNLNRLYPKQYTYRPEHWAADYVNDGRDELRNYMFLSNTIPTASSLLIRKSEYDAVGPFDVSLNLSADWMLYAKILLRSDVAYVAEPLVDFRTHPRTCRMSATKSLRHVEDDYKVTTFIAEAVGLEEEKRKLVRAKMARLWADYLLQGCGIDEPRRMRAVYNNALRLDPNLGQRLLKNVIANAPAGGLKKRLTRAFKGTVKLAAKQVLGPEFATELQRIVMKPA